MRHMILTSVTLFVLASAVVAAQDEVPISVVVHSDDKVLSNNVHAIITKHIRQLPKVVIVTDEQSAWYSIRVSVARLHERKSGESLGWNGALAVVNWIRCGSDQNAVLRYFQVFGGADSSNDTEEVLAGVIDQFDQLLSSDREHWPKR